MALPFFLCLRTQLGLPVFVGILVTLFLPLVNSQGLTLDRCRNTSGCVEPRRCIDVRAEEECTATSIAICVCLPPSLISCLSDDVCPEGEVCAARRTPEGNTGFLCISEVVVKDDSSYNRVTRPNPTEGGLTFENCFRNEDCLAPRICVARAEDAAPGPCIGTQQCLCIPPVFISCESDEDCPPGEKCGSDIGDICVAELNSSGPQNRPNPTAAADPEDVQDTLDQQEQEQEQNSEQNSEQSSEQSSEPDSEQEPDPQGTPQVAPTPMTLTRTVCVAERHMRGMAGVYDTSRYARVLCDSLGSCATAGHLVTYQGSAMMMRRYCEIVGCTESIMKVNSPRWTRRLRLKSWSKGLEFTAFAARYETIAEEAVLVGLVRVGL